MDSPYGDTGPYEGCKSIAFGCTISVVDSPIDYGTFGDLHTSRPILYVAPSPGPKMLGDPIVETLRQSIMLPPTVEEDDMYRGRDFVPTREFEYGVSGKNRSACELWLAAYIGDYIGNCLRFLNLNHVMKQVMIADGMHPDEDTNTWYWLEVKWYRVGIALGSLLAFQLLFAFASLLYCRHNFEIVDDVATISSMFAGFPFGSEKRGSEGAVYQGRFVAEGDGVRWVFEAGTVKNGKSMS